MVKPFIEKHEKQKQPLTTAPDHLAAGAAELRSRAKSCRITAGNVSACRRLEAAAELLSPATVEAADKATEAVVDVQAAGKERAKPKVRKARGPAPEVTAEVEDDAELADLDDDADDEEA